MALVESLQLAAGALLLTGGALALVQGGAALARRMGVSPLWIGLSVVAIGTSAPELVVTVLASVSGASGVAVGNVVGSNILNILVVLGLTALVAPIKVSRATLRRDIVLVVAVSIGVYALAADGVVHWGEGALLLIAAVLYLAYAYFEEKEAWVPAEGPPSRLDQRPSWLQAGTLLVGIAALVAGGHLMVEGGVGMARILGLSDRVIGLTVIAIGTSLPELATSIVALVRKQVDIAIGNLIGSSVMNLLLVLGAGAVVRSLQVDALMLWFDLPIMIAVTLLLWRFAATRGHINRVEGALMIAAYVAYAVVLWTGLVA